MVYTSRGTLNVLIKVVSVTVRLNVYGFRDQQDNPRALKLELDESGNLATHVFDLPNYTEKDSVEIKISARDPVANACKLQILANHMAVLRLWLVAPEG